MATKIDSVAKIGATPNINQIAHFWLQGKILAAFITSLSLKG